MYKRVNLRLHSSCTAVSIVEAIINAQICTKWSTNDRLDAALEGMLDSGLNIGLE